MKGFIRQRGKNRWQIAIYQGRQNGRDCYTWHSVKGGSKDAERERRRLLSALDDGSFVEPSRLSLGDYLAKRWLPYAETQLGSTKTLERYREIVEKHLVPTLGDTRLTKLNPLEISDYYASALKAGRRDGNGGLSAQTVTHHHPQPVRRGEASRCEEKGDVRAR
jgi:hypothetical protein